MVDFRSVFSRVAHGARAARALRAAPSIAVGLVLVLAVAGCSGKSALDDDDLLGGGIRSSEFDTGARTGDRDRGEFVDPERVPELATVYFDFDSFTLRSDARATLSKNAEEIERRREWRTIVLEGHTDERGSEEYNLALGERRANAARQYLADLGIPNTRMQVVSFGESAPAVQGHDESAWRWNRRVEFRVIRQ